MALSAFSCSPICRGLSVNGHLSDWQRGRKYIVGMEQLPVSGYLGFPVRKQEHMPRVLSTYHALEVQGLGCGLGGPEEYLSMVSHSCF